MPEATPEDAAVLAVQRESMVEEHILRRGISDARVLDAMRRVPRHRFMPRETWGMAYDDRPVSIGLRQSISQPYIVALMLELAELQPGSRVLDVGTGSGYQAALLSEMGMEVDTIEILPTLAERARQDLREAGYERVRCHVGDGSLGLPDGGPFSAILVAAAPLSVPPALIRQLAPGGRLIIPVGGDSQQLRRIRRTPDGTTSEDITSVLFVPMTGGAA